MGQLLPVFAAFLVLCFGIQYLRTPKEVGPGPLVSSYIFMFAAFLLLWDIRLYPKSLRKLGIISQCIMEFLVASFLLESLTVDFWFPFETVVLSAAPKLADLLEEMLQSRNKPCELICDVLKNKWFCYVVSYCLSLFFLFAVLHATRAVDFRELENGPRAFFGDIIFRAKRYFRKLKRHFGIGMKKRVQIKENTEPVICPGMNVNRAKNIINMNYNKIKSNKSSCDDLRCTFSAFEMALKSND